MQSEAVTKLVTCLSQRGDLADNPALEVSDHSPLRPPPPGLSLRDGAALTLDVRKMKQMWRGCCIAHSSASPNWSSTVFGLPQPMLAFEVDAQGAVSVSSHTKVDPLLCCGIPQPASMGVG